MRRLRKKKEKTWHGDEQRVNIINSSTSTEGNISCQSSIRFDGKHIGEIYALNKIVVGEKAEIEGNLSANDIEIFGQVNGDCRATNSITLSTSANYHGNIFTKQLIIMEGAILNGKIEMDFESNIEILETKKPRINNPSYQKNNQAMKMKDRNFEKLSSELNKAYRKSEQLTSTKTIP